LNWPEAARAQLLLSVGMWLLIWLIWQAIAALV
jgi:hypothetical protein